MIRAHHQGAALDPLDDCKFIIAQLPTGRVRCSAAAYHSPPLVSAPALGMPRPCANSIMLSDLPRQPATAKASPQRPTA